MKTTKRFLSILMMLCMLATILTATFSVNAAVAVNLIDADKTANLHIYKYEMEDTSLATVRGNGEQTTNIPASAKPLAGVTFTITRVADLVKADGTLDYTYYAKNGAALPTPTEANAMTAKQTYTVTTDADGYADITNVPLGIYLVKETASPSQVTGKVDDFVVSLPMTNSAGTEWNYDVYTYPKNQTKYSSITVSKTDLKIGTALAGAKFSLYSSLNKTSWTLEKSNLTTNASGLIELADLPTSKYYKLVETAAPAGGYVLDTDFSTVVWIDADTNVCDPDTKEIINADNPLAIDITNDKPEIEKKVGTSSNNVTFEDAVIDTVGTTVYYSVKVEIPVVTDMSTYDTLQIYDTLPKALTINGTPVLSDATKTYTAGTDYIYNMDTATNKFTVDIVAENMVVNADYLTLTLNYNCSVNANLVNSLGQEIINTASLKYSSVVGNNEETPDPDPNPNPDPDEITSEETEVHTSGFQFKKVNSSDAVVAGAKFKIYATKADAEAGTNAMSFMDKNGNVITEAVSGSDGYVTFNGLGYGENGNDVTTGETSYWVVETYAPANYNLLSAPVEVKVSQNSFTFANSQFKVVNSVKTLLPLTGGTGTAIFFGVGITLVISGALFLVLTKKKREKAQ